ncbi:MAG: hypothetical protein DRP45_09410 [Candidatus Zixiibacteriota bacterium]|nr:MAG: hypothetical protein DRP45_09410 [candidate division Zixibacteria bacterium]
MAKKPKRPKKQKRAVPKIPRKPTFKESSSLRDISPAELQEWTGDNTPNHDGFYDLVPWPAHDWSKPESASVEATSSEEDTYIPTGRSWADLLHELFIGGQIEILFIVGLVTFFGIILYQDNAAGKWDELESIWISLRKVGIGAGVLFVLYLVVKVLTHGRK